MRDVAGGAVVTAARIAAKTASMQRLGKTKPVKKSTSEDVMPGWYSVVSVPREQQAAAARLLERRGALDLAPMLGVVA